MKRVNTFVATVTLTLRIEQEAAMKRRKYQTRHTVTITDKALADWLIKQGAPVGIASHFGLSKGMGERIDLTIRDSETVEFRFYGASHE
jgi:hypothetical protein